MNVPFPGNPQQLQSISDSLDNLEVLWGSGSTGLGHAEDSAHTTGHMGLMMLAVRQDTQVDFGADGDYVPLSIDSEGNLRVALSGSITVSATGLATEAQQFIQTTHLAAIETAIEGTLAVSNAGLTSLAAAINSNKVDINLVTSAITLPVSLASVPSHAVTNAGTFAVQVDGAALTALQLIDNIVKLEDDAHSTGDAGVMLLAVRQDAQADFAADGDYVPLSIDANGALRVAGGGGGTEYTAGTDTYTEATSVGSMLLAVRRDADTTLVNTTNEFVPLQVDANGYLKVEIFDGGGAHTVDNAGTFAVQVDGAALTALQLIDDTVYVDDADWTGDTSKHVLVGGVYESVPQAITDGDVGPLEVTKNGYLRVATPEEDLANASSTHVKKYYTNAGAVTDGIIWSPGAGKRWFVTDIFISVSAAATVTLEDDLAAGDSAIWKAELAANSGWSHSFRTPWYSGEDAADLIITTSAGNVYVTVTGYEI